MRARFLWLVAASCWILACGCRSPIKPLPPKQALSYQSLLEWSHASGMPGAILLVWTPQTNFVGSIGWADKQRKIPMATNHSFRIGSVTKTFVGIVAAQLHTEGLLHTDLIITNYLPASVFSHISNSDRITVRQLSRHTSGIYDYNDSVCYMLRRGVLNRRGAWPPLRELKYAYDKPAEFPPGESWDYSNSNFLLLAMIIDHVAGGHHSAEIRSRILDPLQLTNTYYEGSEPPRGNLARGYERHFGFTEDVTNWTPPVGGAAGLVSTVEDLAVFIRAIAGTNSYLNEATRQLLRSQPRPGNLERPWFPVSGYDFGLNNARRVPEEVPLCVAPLFFGHAGGLSGYLCFAWHEPRRNITIVFFGSSNLTDVLHHSRNFQFEHLLEEALFDLTVKQSRRVSAQPTNK
jgi:D-alanyl-D-alanine carboxypeptidase